eukprot:1154238-Pelagomonas_calceolata.AAC.4
MANGRGKLSLWMQGWHTFFCLLIESACVNLIDLLTGAAMANGRGEAGRLDAGAASDVDSDADQELEGGSRVQELQQVNGNGSMSAVEQVGRAAVHAQVGKGEDAKVEDKEQRRGRVGNGTVPPKKAGKIMLPRSLYERLTPRSDAAVMERVRQEVQRAAAETGFRQLNSLFPGGAEQALAVEQAGAVQGLSVQGSVQDEGGEARAGPGMGVGVGVEGAELPTVGVLEGGAHASSMKHSHADQTARAHAGQLATSHTQDQTVKSADEMAQTHTLGFNTKDAGPPVTLQSPLMYTVRDLALQRMLRRVR